MAAERPVDLTFGAIDLNIIDSIVDLWQQFDRSLQKRKVYQVDVASTKVSQTFENIQLAAAICNTTEKKMRKVIRDELTVGGFRYVFASRVNVHK